MPWPARAAGAYPGRMGWVWKILGAALAVWFLFMAVGSILATLKTFVIAGLIAAAVVIIVSVLARRHRDKSAG